MAARSRVAAHLGRAQASRRWHARPVAGGAWLALLLSAACDSELSFGRVRDAGSLLEADATTHEPAPPAPFSCELTGPWFDLSDGTHGACGTASRGFHFALCACEELGSRGDTLVDGFDSRKAAYSPDLRSGVHSGSLATNRALHVARTQVGGSLIIAGTTGAPLTGGLDVGGNLLDQGPLLGPSQSVTVGGDLRVAGAVQLAHLSVAGAFVLAPSAALEVPAAAPTPMRGSVSVPPACRCDNPLDIGALVQAASQDNRNAAIGLDPRESLRVFDSAREVPLPCGRYYVTDLYAAQPLTLRVQGRVALYVENDIIVERTGRLTVLLENDAEFDLFVKNNITASGPVELGSPRRPTHTRVYIGGSKSLVFDATTQLAATLYAPQAELVSNSSLELYGAALVRKVAAASLALHYDRALARDLCSAATCTQTSDCQPPLRCDQGQCLP